MLGIRASNVSTNQLLTRGGHFQEVRVLILDGHVLGVTQQLPHNRPEVVRDPSSDKILWGEKKDFCGNAIFMVQTELLSVKSIQVEILHNSCSQNNEQ